MGHLFNMESASDWYDPCRNFVYSCGQPRGMSKKGEEVKCAVLVDSRGEMVPCRVSHSTCMYIKASSFTNSLH